MNSSYGVLRVVHTEDETNKEAAASAETTGLGAWDLPGYPGNTASLPDPLYLLTESITTIGRGLNNHVVLMDPTVSREHARLIWRNGIWALENLSAQNLLHVDKVNIPPGKQREVRPGALMVLGQTTLQLLAPRGERPARAAQATEKTADSAEIAELQESEPAPAEQPPLQDISAKQVDAQVLAMFAKGEKKAGGLLSMSPGVTLQFAVRQRLDRGKLWALGTIAVV